MGRTKASGKVGFARDRVAMRSEVADELTSLEGKLNVRAQRQDTALRKSITVADRLNRHYTERLVAELAARLERLERRWWNRLWSWIRKEAVPSSALGPTQTNPEVIRQSSARPGAGEGDVSDG